MNIRNLEQAKSILLAAISLLEEKGYKAIEKDSEFDKKVDAHFSPTVNITGSDYMLKLHVAPAKWPHFEKFPNVNLQENQFPGAVFILISERQYAAEGFDWYMHYSEKDEMMALHSISEDKLSLQWSLTMKCQPLFSNQENLLITTPLYEDMANAAEYIQAKEEAAIKWFNEPHTHQARPTLTERDIVVEDNFSNNTNYGDGSLSTGPGYDR